MDGLAALRRIAFLLERSLAPTYRVKAFRTAALAIATLPADELATRIREHSLTELPGVGPKTAAVVEEAATGAVPAYLADLEASAGPLDPAGADLRTRLRGDLHSHSDWSDGGSPIEEMAITGLELGHDYLALTDHSPRLTVAHGLTAKRLEKQLTLVAAMNRQLGDGFRLLSGIECDINEDGTLDQTDELLGRVDIVVGSVHSKLRADSATMTKRMLAGIDEPVHRRPRALHRPAGDRRPRHPAAQLVRREEGVRRVRRARRGGGDQQPSGTARPAAGAAQAGRRRRLPVQHRHRRARPRAARLPDLRLRPGRRVRGAGGPDRQHLAAGRTAGLDHPGPLIRTSRTAD